jgi:hypothetical protein
MLSRLLLMVVWVVAGCARTRPSAADHTHVVLVIVDGLDARLATPAHMPRLFAVLAGDPAHSSFFSSARAVMPTRTNPNHVTLLTGVYPEVHGITGNAGWNRIPGAPPAKLDSAALIEVETLFTVAKTGAPERVTLGVFGKPKLARLFAAAPGQRAPDRLWSPDDLPPARREPTTGYASDVETMGAALEAMRAAEPDLAVVNLPDVDRTGHARGPDAPEYAEAVAGADAAIGRLVDELQARGRWRRTILFVTADHGMSSVAPAPGRPRPVISLGAAGLGDVTFVGDGGVEHVYADAPGIERTVRLAGATPGVAEVLARLPGSAIPTIADRHPDWHLDHPRTGDLLLVAASGHQFVDPFDAVDAKLLGNHGGPENRPVPLAVMGGSPALHAAPAGTPSPELVDVAPTIARLLALRPPRRLDGSAVPPEGAGHALALFGQSPH